MFDVSTTVFQHFKGGMYRGVRLKTLDDRPGVWIVYKSLTDGRIWERKLDGFFAEIETNLGLRPRFLPLDPDYTPYGFAYKGKVWTPENFPAMCTQKQVYVKQPEARDEAYELFTTDLLNNEKEVQ